MNLLAALVLLSSASDSFSSFSGWQPGLRGMPDASIVQMDGDSCLRLSATTAEPVPGVDEIVRSFPRPVVACEKPLATFRLYVPEVVTGTVGARLTIIDQHNRAVWPGVFATPDGWRFRVLNDYATAPIASTGWQTVAIDLAADGQMRFWINDALAFEDQHGWTYVRSFDGWFLQVQTSQPWFFGSVQLYADVPPLRIERAGEAVTLTPGYPGMVIERSVDLANWLPCASPDLITEPAQFYRYR